MVLGHTTPGQIPECRAFMVSGKLFLLLIFLGYNNNNVNCRRSRSTMERGLMLALAFSPPPTRHNTIGGNILTTQDVNQPALSQRVARYEMTLLDHIHL